MAVLAFILQSFRILVDYICPKTPESSYYTSYVESEDSSISLDGEGQSRVTSREHEPGSLLRKEPEYGDSHDTSMESLDPSTGP